MTASPTLSEDTKQLYNGINGRRSTVVDVKSGQHDSGQLGLSNGAYPRLTSGLIDEWATETAALTDAVNSDRH